MLTKIHNNLTKINPKLCCNFLIKISPNFLNLFKIFCSFSISDFLQHLLYMSLKIF